MAPGRTLTKLTSYLTDARARGDFIGDDPELAANMFIGLIMGKVLPVRLFIPHLDDSSPSRLNATSGRRCGSSSASIIAVGPEAAVRPDRLLGLSGCPGFTLLIE